MALAATAKPGVEQPYAIHADLAHLSHDQHLASKIMRKRQDEMARRTKLLDPRTRQFGVDHNVLNAQVAEKQAAARAEAAEDVYHAAVQRTQGEVLQHLETLRANIRRERQEATIDFSLTNLRKEQRREYALSDPHALRQETAMTEDEVAKCGLSSMQVFEGQKLGGNDRKKEMQQGMKEYLTMQMQEKEARNRADKEWHDEADRQASLANHVRAHCEQSDMMEMRNDKIAEAEENRMLAMTHAEQKKAKLAREAAEREKHCATVMHQDKMRMAQDYQLASNGKLVRTEYRRLTLEEEQDVYNQNAQIILEKRARKQQEDAEEAAHARQVAGHTALLHHVESTKQAMHKERTRNSLKDNDAMAAAKREKDVQERRSYMSYD